MSSKTKKSISHSKAKHVAHKVRKAVQNQPEMTDQQFADAVDAMLGQVSTSDNFSGDTGNTDGILPLYAIASNIMDATTPDVIGDAAAEQVFELTNYGSINEPGAKTCVETLLAALPTSWNTPEAKSIREQLNFALTSFKSAAYAD